MTKPHCAKFFGGVLLLFFSFCIHQLQAANISAKATGDWSNPTTWNGGVVPGAADSVLINGNFTVTVKADAGCKYILLKGLASG
ncbi:MAG: hypothetical protein V4616_10860, partial [Bacteroidota bacterium]